MKDGEESGNYCLGIRVVTGNQVGKMETDMETAVVRNCPSAPTLGPKPKSRTQIQGVKPNSHIW